MRKPRRSAGSRPPPSDAAERAGQCRCGSPVAHFRTARRWIPAQEVAAQKDGEDEDRDEKMVVPAETGQSSPPLADDRVGMKGRGLGPGRRSGGHQSAPSFRGEIMQKKIGRSPASRWWPRGRTTRQKASGRETSRRRSWRPPSYSGGSRRPTPGLSEPDRQCPALTAV